MTSRERVRKLLNREQTDRIPNGLGGCETAGLHILAYEKLKNILGVKKSRTRLDTFMVNAIVEPEVLEAMSGDIILLGSPRMCNARFWRDESKADWKDQMLWGVEFLVSKSETFYSETDGTYWWGKSKCPPGGIFFDFVRSDDSSNLHHSYRNITPDDYQPCHDIPDEKLRTLEEQARWLYDNTDYSINCGETIEDLQVTNGLSLTDWWMLLVEEPDMVREILHKACEAALSQLKLLDQAIGKYTDILSIAHDFGDLRGVTIGPALWREIFKPFYKRLFTEWHNITNMKINLHSCGSIIDILPDLVECGVDIINPVQISARGMNPLELKKQFGDKLIFYGGCFDSVQCPPGTPDEIVYETVRENIKTLSRNGGYIFAGVHNIPGDVPESHLKAVLDAYNACRQY